MGYMSRPAVKTNGDVYVQAYDFDCDAGGLDPVLVFGTAVITAAATFQLYTQVTSGGKRRKRRRSGGGQAVPAGGGEQSGLWQLFLGSLSPGSLRRFYHICYIYDA